jgi:hypothetical protein
MNHLKKRSSTYLLPILFLALFTIYSCSCRNTDCPASPLISLKVFSDGKKVVGYDSVELRGRNEKNEWHPVALSRDNDLFYFRLDPQYTYYVVDYAFATSDSLDFSYKIISGGCCDSYVDEYEIKINKIKKPVVDKYNEVFIFEK